MIKQPLNDAILLGWEHGPLPDQALEQIALKIFARQHPMAAFAEPGFSAERDDARRFALQLAVDFAKRDRWTPKNAAEQLADQTAALVFGDRRLGPTLRAEVAAIAAAYVAGLWTTFRDRLRLPAQIEANQREIEQERAS